MIEAAGADDSSAPNRVRGELVTKMYLGDQVQLVATVSGGDTLIAREQRSVVGSAVERLEPGDAVQAHWDASAPLLLADTPAQAGTEEGEDR